MSLEEDMEFAAYEAYCSDKGIKAEPRFVSFKHLLIKAEAELDMAYKTLAAHGHPLAPGETLDEKVRNLIAEVNGYKGMWEAAKVAMGGE